MVEVLDALGDLRCVRFQSGRVGVVDSGGKVLLRLGNAVSLEFAEHGFVKATSRKAVHSLHKAADAQTPKATGNPQTFHCPNTYFVDLKSKQMYSQMPEILRFGDFEIAYICRFLCTRTRQFYEVKSHPSFVWKGKGGLYLSLPYDGVPEGNVINMMLEKPGHIQVCLLKGDERKVYWLLGKFEDDSVLVMDSKGVHYYVWLNNKSGKVHKRKLGSITNEVERSMMMHAVDDIEVEVDNRIIKEQEMAKSIAARNRNNDMRKLKSVIPFCIGNKWGLRQEGRIITPPIYRNITPPVGRYCAFEMYPEQWGVLAIDGKVEVEPRYQEVVIYKNGMVDLTVVRGKIVSKKLP